MRSLDLFAGAGGGLLAGKLLGWTSIGYVEWEPYCQKVLQARIADGYLDAAPIFGDIRKFISEGYAASYTGMVDVLASHSQPQDSSSQKMTLKTNGQPRRMPFALLDQKKSCWKTSQGCLLPDMPQSSPLIWPRSAMWDETSCYLLPQRARTISAKESGFMATPTATANQLAPSMMKHRGCRNWLPTPTAHNSKEFAYPAEYTRNTPTLGAQLGGKPNPEFIEWMMGWPIGWTNACKPLETGKFQSWLHAHGRS